MPTTPNKPEGEPASDDVKPPESASESVPATLAALHVNPDTGLTAVEVDARRKEHGYNEVVEQEGHPALKFLGKFWGLSAWMLELIMLLSLALRNYADLVIVGDAQLFYPGLRRVRQNAERIPVTELDLDNEALR